MKVVCTLFISFFWRTLVFFHHLQLHSSSISFLTSAVRLGVKLLRYLAVWCVFTEHFRTTVRPISGKNIRFPRAKAVIKRWIGNIGNRCSVVPLSTVLLWQKHSWNKSKGLVLWGLRHQLVHHLGTNHCSRWCCALISQKSLLTKTHHYMLWYNCEKYVADSEVDRRLFA